MEVKKTLKSGEVITIGKAIDRKEVIRLCKKNGVFTVNTKDERHKHLKETCDRMVEDKVLFVQSIKGYTVIYAMEKFNPLLPKELFV